MCSVQCVEFSVLCSLCYVQFHVCSSQLVVLRRSTACSKMHFVVLSSQCLEFSFQCVLCCVQYLILSVNCGVCRTHYMQAVCSLKCEVCSDRPLRPIFGISWLAFPISFRLMKIYLPSGWIIHSVLYLPADKSHNRTHKNPTIDYINQKHHGHTKPNPANVKSPIADSCTWVYTRLPCVSVRVYTGGVKAEE